MLGLTKMEVLLGMTVMRSITYVIPAIVFSFAISQFVLSAV